VLHPDIAPLRPTDGPRKISPVVRRPPSVARYPAAEELTPAALELLDRVVALQLVEPSLVGPFLQERTDRLAEYDSDERFGQGLVQAGLLTQYQLDRVLTGSTHGLLLGSYRVLEHLGNGGMGTVYLAEHRLMRRRVAVKVLPLDEECPPSVRQRFYSEVRLLAELNHPNIVLAFDAGELPPEGPDMPGLIYLVMEVIDSGDLEKVVLKRGRLPVAEACDFVRQAACGLQAAHDRHLIHRDVKPSNLLLTASGQVKLVDFGLARQFYSRLTDPRALLGSVEFMAPEQSHDPSSVGKAADLYGLGATLFWLLAGEPPYPFNRSVGGSLRALQQEEPRRLRQLRPDAPQELDDLIARLLDRNPARRPLPPATTHALTPFLMARPGVLAARPESHVVRSNWTTTPQALVIDDDPSIRQVLRLVLQDQGCHCQEACDGIAGIAAAEQRTFDLVLLDLNMPGMGGYEVCRRLRELGQGPHLKIIIISGEGDQNDLSEALPRGADDYAPKPFHTKQIVAKVRHALNLKEAQDRVTQLAEQLFLSNRQLQQSLRARSEDVQEAQDALLFTMAKMAESRDGETSGHLRRLPEYAVVLAQAVSNEPSWTGLIDDRFLEHLHRCAPLHDIGKIGLPDDLLLKPGALNAAERALMETHTTIGDRMLEALANEHGNSLEFLGMARGIVRHHHERHDGRGYPDRLSGDAIPAAARLTAVADVYDALRRERQHKAAMNHADSMRILLQESPGQFDPALMTALRSCHREFERIFRVIAE
jgi:response regulator RpfG family c-di-GMP phosphodiesterase/serine/threonine protein kinase